MKGFGTSGDSFKFFQGFARQKVVIDDRMFIDSSWHDRLQLASGRVMLVTRTAVVSSSHGELIVFILECKFRLIRIEMLETAPNVLHSYAHPQAVPRTCY